MTRLLPAFLPLLLACADPAGSDGKGQPDSGLPQETASPDDSAGDDGAGDDTAGGGDTADPVDPVDACAPAAPFAHFITREGDQLMDGDEPFRFVSVNTPDLLGIVDPGWFIPTPWEQRDALCSVRQMGGRVARTYVLSVGSPVGGVPRHVEGPGLLNEEQMVSLDEALAAANEQGVRLIIPLVDQWWWVGGIAEHAAFRGKSADQFWTDPTLIADFISLIDQLAHRVNTVTGLTYAEDPAILAWETGNELAAPPAWTAQIAAVLKEADPNHLVLDGHYGVVDESLDNEDIDLVTNHYYWPAGYGEDYAAAAAADRARTAGRRPFFVGEYGFVPTSRVQALLDEVVDNGSAGALIWSLRFHDESGGFYFHNETSYGGTQFAAYHWPGFDSGDGQDERAVLAAIVDAAAAVGPGAPALAPPAPQLLAVDLDGSIAFQGAAGAAAYTLERAAEEGGPYTVIVDGVDDARSPNQATTADPSPPTSGQSWYRLRAIGPTGLSSEPSAPWGPVTAGRAFFDPLDNLDLVDWADATIVIDSSNPGYLGGDSGRATRSSTADASLAWAPGGLLLAVEVTAYAWPHEDLPELVFATSPDGSTWTTLPADLSDLGGDWTELRYSAHSLPADATHLRITLHNPSANAWTPQVGAVSIITAP